MKTTDGGYYKLTARQKAGYKRQIHVHQILLTPFVWTLSRLVKFDFKNASVVHDDINLPKGMCNPESIKAAADYVPSSSDLFVVSQMKCGTTWMQQICHQVLNRGENDLSESGVALNSISSWLESHKTVSMSDSPLIGDSPNPDSRMRLSKTHLPLDCFPYNDAAKYVYVTRHPVSCFASCYDFLLANTGQLAPTIEQCADWFCDPESMWFGDWTAHQMGWIEKSNVSPAQVLVVRFEDLKKGFAKQLFRIVDFLELAPLSESEITKIEKHTGFSHMKSNEHCFEMNPPHFFQNDQSFFVSGNVNRKTDVPTETAKRIQESVLGRAEEIGFTSQLRLLYPDLLP